MLSELLPGVVVSFINFGIHAVMTGLVVIATHHVGAAVDELHVFARVSALLLITMTALMAAHIAEISVWAAYYNWAGIGIEKAGPFEFAFENYTAVGYGDEVPSGVKRLVGPITALNGLLLIGWSVAIIFEVMRMAEVQIKRRGRSSG